MAEMLSIKTRTMQTNGSAIKVLRAYLEMAEKGEIVGVAIAAVEPGGSCFTQATESDYYQPLLGALSILQWRMINGKNSA